MLRPQQAAARALLDEAGQGWGNVVRVQQGSVGRVQLRAGAARAKMVLGVQA